MYNTQLYKDGVYQVAFGPEQLAALLADGWSTERGAGPYRPITAPAPESAENEAVTAEPQPEPPAKRGKRG